MKRIHHGSILIAAAGFGALLSSLAAEAAADDGGRWPLGAAPLQASPAGVAAQGLDEAVQLNWTPAEGAIAYNVYQGTSAGAEADTPVLSGVVGSSVTLTGLRNDTQYFFKVSATGGAGESARSVEVRAIPYLPIVDAPTFSAGTGTYTSIQHVSIRDSAAGASIHYTTDGSLPTAASALYQGSLTIDSNTTLRAIAMAPGHSASGITTAVYTLNLPPAVAVPVFSVLGGTYPNTQYVDITDGTPGATIYYTTDGSDPTPDSTPYSGTIQIKATTTLKAVATAKNYSNSPIASATYTIKPPPASGGGAMGWDVLAGLCALLLLRDRKFKFARQKRRR